MTLLILMSSCSAQKRLNRLIDRHPQLAQSEIVKLDTTFNVTLPGVTLIKNKYAFIPFDTVTIRKDQFHAEIIPFIDSSNNYSFEFSGGCDTVTVTKTITKEVTVPTVVYRKPRDRLTRWIVGLIILLGIIIIKQKFN